MEHTENWQPAPQKTERPRSRFAKIKALISADAGKIRDKVTYLFKDSPTARESGFDYHLPEVESPSNPAIEALVNMTFDPPESDTAEATSTVEEESKPISLKPKSFRPPTDPDNRFTK